MGKPVAFQAPLASGRTRGRFNAGRIRVHTFITSAGARGASPDSARAAVLGGALLFTFLRHHDLDATNWRGEHAMRYAVVNCKVWGGNRTDRGADNQAILMSVLRTLKLRKIQPIEWLRK